MNVQILASTRGDNYFYLVSHAGKALLIDPVDAPVAIAAVRDAGLELIWVVNTHFHPDHVAGDDEVLAAFPDAKLVVGRVDAPMVENLVEHAIDVCVDDGDTVPLNGLSLAVIDTPGHTAGHISLLGDGWLFSGDTIFVGGAGNCRFGGDPKVLFHTYRDVIAGLDGDVQFAPGHDYAVRNIEFLLSIEPQHEMGLEMLDRAKSESDGVFLTTLREERAYNPFFRYDDASLQKSLEARHPDVYAAERSESDSDTEAVFRTLRSLRNSW